MLRGSCSMRGRKKKEYKTKIRPGSLKEKATWKTQALMKFC